MTLTISFDTFLFNQEMIDTLREYKIELISISPTFSLEDPLRLEIKGEYLNLQNLMKLWGIPEYTTKIEYN